MKRGDLARAAGMFVLLLLPLALAGGCGGGSGGDGGGEDPDLVRDVGPGMGIEAQQVSFWDPQVPVDNTSWGRLWIDPTQLEKETGIQRGWLNVATDQGWVVVNLPIPDAAEGPFAVYFDLGLSQSEALQQIALHMKHSSRGFREIADSTTQAANFPVAHVVVNERGLSPVDRMHPGPPPFALSLESILTQPREITTWVQMTTNEECAQNQCAPMATANAFQYLEDMGVWTVPHVHDLGLGGDATLVGQLDTLSGRAIASRSVGSGVYVEEIVDACLAYVATNGLAAGMTFRHQDEGWASSLPAVDYNAHGLTSQFDGGVPTFAWLWDRVRAGCAVTAGYSHAFGGHMVRVTGVKVDSEGNAWMRYTHDSIQTGNDPTDTLGLETVWVLLSDLDADGILNMGATSRELRVVWAACP